LAVYFGPSDCYYIPAGGGKIVTVKTVSTGSTF